ncbi:MAG: hypothetical protein VR72_16840 [Clostridiaceae bacterium BRH_c20a]|nr:MAG: hypothetical protein VR72_16840 [Clostridiaceae bacterium BRH_c20a]
MRDRIAGLSLLSVTIFLFMNVNIVARPSMTTKGINASFWPKLLLIILALLSIGIVIGSFINSKEKFDLKIIFNKRNLKFVLTVLVCIIYTSILEILGFIIATPMMLMLLLAFIGIKKKSILFSVPFIVTICMTLLFSTLIKVPLPVGVSVFRVINKFLI